jgi:hypothetical protein
VHTRGCPAGASPTPNDVHGPTLESGLPKRNYGYEKRQKELHKQQKREDKLKRKLERADVPTDEPTGDESAPPPAE